MYIVSRAVLVDKRIKIKGVSLINFFYRPFVYLRHIYETVCAPKQLRSINCNRVR